MMMVCTVENVRKTEENAAKAGMSYFSMMENAGKSVAEEILKRKEVNGKKVLVLCGGGNNGGDGYVVARLLEEKGAFCKVMAFAEPQSEAAKFARKLYIGDFTDKSLEEIYEADIIVDAVFGTGLKRKAEGEYAEIIKAVNRSKAYTASVDIPSGLFADSGEENLCVNADLTVTFIAYKTCHLMFPARNYCGEIVLSAIGVPPSAFEGIDIIGKVIEPPVLKKRQSDTHKGSYGTACLVVGSYGMAGAAILSLKGCIKSGVGIAKATVPEEIYPIITVGVPEAVCNVYGRENIKTACDKAMDCDALLMGCGLSKDETQREIFSYIIKNFKKKLIIDADGINLLSENIECIKHSEADIVLTPHPLEMARLCKTEVANINKNRIFYAKKLSSELSCTVVLKGAVTVVCDKDGQVYFNVTGNPSMAKGGSGDVLAGIIVSFAAQGYSCEEAARMGVCIHGLAGDVSRDKNGEISALPSELIDSLSEVFKKLGE